MYPIKKEVESNHEIIAVGYPVESYPSPSAPNVVDAYILEDPVNENKGEVTSSQPIQQSSSPSIINLDPLSALTSIKSFHVIQRIPMNDSIAQGIFESSNKYEIFTNNGTYLFSAREQSGECSRCCCHPHHRATLSITPVSAPHIEVFKLYKPYKCCCPAVCPCFMKESVFFGGQQAEILAYVQQPCLGGGIYPYFNLYDRPQGTRVGYVTGTSCLVGGNCGSSVFRVYNTEHQVVGIIDRVGQKNERNVTTESFNNLDRLSLTFEENVNNQQKAVLFSTLLLIDMLFFEEMGGNISVCWFPKSYKLCDMYCFGGPFPFHL